MSASSELELDVDPGRQVQAMEPYRLEVASTMSMTP
jgi:hypothetical protein